MSITLRQWAAELREASDELKDKMRQVVEDSAKTIRDDWRARWKGIDAPYLWAAVTYDIVSEGELIRAEIGPDKSLPQGPLGNLVEFGSIHNPPHPGGSPALDAEEPRFIQAVEDALADALEGSGD